MLNILLSALGLPKRVENTPQTPALRRIAGLEVEVDELKDTVEGLREVLESYIHNAVVQAKRIDALEKASRMASTKASTKRQQTRDPWTVRYRAWLAKASKAEQEILNKTLAQHFQESLVKAAFAVGLCEWLRHNRLADLPDAGGYVRSTGFWRFKVAIPDLQNPDTDPVNFGVATQLEQRDVQSQWKYLARYVHGELHNSKGRKP
jgi:hypothetical protein